MAIFYNLYCDLELTNLEQRLAVAAEAAGALWQEAIAFDDLGPFHLEVMAEYGVEEEFASKCFTRHNKFRTEDARAAMLAFYESLPGRKLLLNGDVLVASRLD
jgi:hypothetical protein